MMSAYRESTMAMSSVVSRLPRLISESEDHPTVEQLYERARSLDDGISLATVYRTIKLMEDVNILDKHDFRGAKARYEEVTEEHHDHLIDVNTGEVVEFANEEIERLQEIIARELGYRLVGHRLELYGAKIAAK